MTRRLPPRRPGRRAPARPGRSRPSIPRPACVVEASIIRRRRLGSGAGRIREKPGSDACRQAGLGEPDASTPPRAPAGQGGARRSGRRVLSRAAGVQQAVDDRVEGRAGAHLLVGQRVLGQVVAPDVHRPPLGRQQLGDDRPPRFRPASRHRREPSRERRDPSPARPAPAPSRAPGRRSPRLSISRAPCARAAAVLEVPAHRLVEGVGQQRVALALPVLSAISSSEGDQRAVLAERVPAQVALFRNCCTCLGAEPPAPVSKSPPPVHQRHDREHAGAGAQLEDREEVGQVVAQDVAGDRDRVLAAADPFEGEAHGLHRRS
jgi:hypothetical protein